MSDVAHRTELRAALNGSKHPEAREAACALGRLRGRALAAVDDPQGPRLVEIIRKTIHCSNYGIQKSSVFALVKIGSKEAIETVYHIARYWRASPKSVHFKKLIYKVLGELESKGLDKLLDDPSAARAQLNEWLEGKRLGPPCPHCGAALRTSAAKQCFHCGRDWHDQEESTPWS
jgi:hypothetical protein